MIGGAGVRHFMNVRYRGNGLERATSAWLAPAIGAAAIAIAGLMVVTRIAERTVDLAEQPVTFKRVQAIIGNRCAPCHSAKPSDDMFRQPPANVMFDTPAQIQMMAQRILVRAVEQQSMPFNNKTGMTIAERGELGRWIRDGAKLD